MSNLPDDYNSHNVYCIRHNLHYHPVDGCSACEQEPTMLTPYIPEAKDVLSQIERVRQSYEHRINVVQGYIDDMQRQLETLYSEHQEIESMERSLDYDIDCVLTDETPDGFHINEIMDGEFTMPEPVQCDCSICRIDATIERVEGMLVSIADLEKE